MKKSPLIKIKNELGKEVVLTQKNATRNVLVLGTTGSGKTTGVLLPAIENLIKNDNCGLILDIKAEMYEDVYAIAKDLKQEDKIVFIGSKSCCKPINLMNSINTVEQVANFLRSLIPNRVNGDSYWAEGGVRDTVNMIKLDMLLHTIQDKKYTFDITTILNYINLPHNNVDIINELNKHRDKIRNKDLKILDAVINGEFSLYNLGKSKIYNDNDKHTIEEQSAWRSGQVSQALNEFFEDDIFFRLFSPENNTTLYDLIFNENKIVCFVMDQQFEKIGWGLSKATREIYYRNVLSNDRSKRKELQIGEEFDRYCFLLIDEYQNFITIDDSNGITTDDDWSSKSRSYGNINIYATQSLNHLINKTDISTTNVLKANCVNQFIFNVADEDTENHCKFLYSQVSPEGDFEFLKNPSKRELISRIVKEDGSINVFRCSLDISNQDRFHFDKYKNSKEKFISLLPQYDFVIEERKLNNTILSVCGDNIITEQGVYDINIFLDMLNENISYNSLNNTAKNYNNRLLLSRFFLTPNNINDIFNVDEAVSIINSANLVRIKRESISFDENYISLDYKKNEEMLSNKSWYCNDEYKEEVIKNIKYHLIRLPFHDKQKICFFLPNSKNNLASGDVKSNLTKNLDKCFFSTHKKITTLLDLNGKQLKDFNDNYPVVCITRGGSSDQTFDLFRNVKLWNTFRKKYKGVIISALGHADHCYYLDLIADITLNTPTDAGIVINSVLNQISRISSINEKTLMKKKINKQENSIIQAKHSIASTIDDIFHSDTNKETTNLLTNIKNTLNQKYEELEHLEDKDDYFDFFGIFEELGFEIFTTQNELNEAEIVLQEKLNKKLITDFDFNLERQELSSLAVEKNIIELGLNVKTDYTSSNIDKHEPKKIIDNEIELILDSDDNE